MKRIILLLPVLLQATAVQAASFDCSKASTKIEKTICSDTELSKLDGDLSEIYQSALQKELQIKTVRYDQKEWLKIRNGCLDRDCIKEAYVSRIAQLTLGNNLRITKGADSPVCVKVKNGYVLHIDFNLMHALRPDSTEHQSYEDGLARADIDNNGHLENVGRVREYRGAYESSFMATTDDSKTSILATPLNKALQGIEANNLFVLNGVTYIDINGGGNRSVYKVEHENADLVCEFQRYTSFSEG